MTQRDEPPAKHGQRCQCRGASCPQRTRPLLAPSFCGKWEREFVALVSSLWEENPRASVGRGGAAQHAELLSFPSCCCWKRPGGFPHAQDGARSMQGATWHPLPYSFISGSWEAFRRSRASHLYAVPQLPARLVELTSKPRQCKHRCHWQQPQF